MESFTPVASTVGGIAIGVAVLALLLLDGRIAGVSGMFARALDDVARVRRSPSTETASPRWLPLAFVVGLVSGGLVLRVVMPGAFEGAGSAALPVAAVAGLLVGFGTRLANGCTSGHGVAGLARLSPRSVVATLTFIATGAATVFVARHLVGP